MPFGTFYFSNNVECPLFLLLGGGLFRDYYDGEDRTLNECVGRVFKWSTVLYRAYGTSDWSSLTPAQQAEVMRRLVGDYRWHVYPWPQYSPPWQSR